MRSIGFMKKWSGNWSNVLNFLSPFYPNIMFELPTIGFGLILNIPEEYDYEHVLTLIRGEFLEKYNITNFDFENSRIILISL